MCRGVRWRDFVVSRIRSVDEIMTDLVTPQFEDNWNGGDDEDRGKCVEACDGEILLRWGRCSSSLERSVRVRSYH